MTEPEQDGAEAVTDAVVLAGSKGSLRFTSIEGQQMAKPFLRLGGEAMVSRSVEAALQAAGVGRVYVVGDPEALAECLRELVEQHGDRLVLVPEGENLLDNCLRAFFDHLLPGQGYADAVGIGNDPERVSAFQASHPEALQVGALLVTSDLPFLSVEDVEAFLASTPAGVAVTAGICDHAELERMQAALGHQTVLDSWKLGAIPLSRREVRWNNLWLVRPLLASPVLYRLLEEVYEHRWLLDQDGRILWHNWWAILGSLARHSVRVRGRLRFIRGLGNALLLMLTTGLVRWTRRAGRFLAAPFRWLLRKRDFDFTASLLIGAPARMQLSPDVAPAIDIDVEEIYQALVADGEENYRRVARYLGRLPEAQADPGADADAQAPTSPDGQA